MYHRLAPKGKHIEYLQLRQAYPVFTYQSYEIKQDEKGYNLSFLFDIAGKFHFKPEIFIPNRSFYAQETDRALLENLAFHIGMVELISYWKLSCAPIVKIMPHKLTDEQVNWWKKLYYHGLGEFFYLNGIQAAKDDFMQLNSYGTLLPQATSIHPNEELIVPVGGGKDSVVSLELLRNDNRNIRPMIVNPRAASMASAQIAGFSEDETIIVNRQLDPLMLQLNNEGFLNGHTPFSALLAFITVFTASISGKRYIALSNESSASEASVLGTDINHQYSKSIEFESDFRNYLNQYIVRDIEYFSLLRPLNELQIAKLFSTYKQYHSVFKSCNVDSKTDSWCCTCPKCLFTWIMLSPFLQKKELIHIFKEDLSENTDLLPLMESLRGKTASKPFECVGTIEEVNAAYYHQSQKSNAGSLFAPAKDEAGASRYQAETFEMLLQQFDSNHLLHTDFESIIKRAIYD